MANIARVLFLLMACSIASYGQVEMISQQVNAKQWNNYVNEWQKADISFGVDGRTTYVYAATGANQCQFLLSEDSQSRVKFIGLLKKSLEWEAKAKAEQLSAKKLIGEASGVTVTFLSEHAGDNIGVLLTIPTLKFSSQSSNFLIDRPQIERMISILERIPAVIAEDDAMRKRADTLLK